MIGKIFAVLCTVSFIAAIFCGNTGALGEAVFTGAEKAVTLSISLLGATCLWCGIMRVFAKTGVTARLTKLLKPLLRLIYPHASKTEAADDIAASMSANLLGLSNAATPLGIKAMRSLESCPSDELIRFAVLGTTSIQLIPTTVLALRSAAGSANAGAVIIPIWICSAVCFLFAVLLTFAFAAICGKKGR